mmetsp:Transcript_52325/g.150796  ORF Transcript_52325/g.150796 Transcript_52325/m.150796 type:complete len:262 (-) Transcript_52325:13-798(-)
MPALAKPGWRPLHYGVHRVGGEARRREEPEDAAMEQLRRQPAQSMCRKRCSVSALPSGQEQQPHRRPTQLVQAQQSCEPSRDGVDQSGATFQKRRDGVEIRREHIVGAPHSETAGATVRVHHLKVGRQHQGREAGGPPWRAVAHVIVGARASKAQVQRQQPPGVLGTDAVQHAANSSVKLVEASGWSTASCGSRCHQPAPLRRPMAGVVRNVASATTAGLPIAPAAADSEGTNRGRRNGGHGRNPQLGRRNHADSNDDCRA